MRRPSMGLTARLLLHTVTFQAALILALFGAAGTWRFWPAWGYVGIQLVTTTVTNVHLVRNDRALLERRLRRGDQDETDRVQRLFQALVGPVFVALLVVAGLDHRFGWSTVPTLLILAGQGIALASYVLVYLAFRANTFASSLIEVEAGQTVVATGPYRLVRHPMYTGAVLGAVGIPLALGSWWAELFLVPIVALVVVRLLREERFLRARLPGYAEYTASTPHRLIPGAW